MRIRMDPNSIDWAGVWDEAVRRYLVFHGMEDGIYWKDKKAAIRFSEHAKRDNWAAGREKLHGIGYDESSRVLDIGPGPGTMAIPFAEKAAHVTTVESSAPMAEVLMSNAEEAGLGNIDTVCKDWLDTDVDSDLSGKYDVVIASHSLGMPDIRCAIEKMQAACCGRIYLYFFSGLTSWDQRYAQLWPLLHGTEYVTLPRMNILYNVLYSMGIYPNMDVTARSFFTTYESIDAACDAHSMRCGVQSDEKRTILEQYLSKELELKDGKYYEKESFLDTKVWWDVRERKD